MSKEKKIKQTNGKGDKSRISDKKKFDKNWERIFGSDVDTIKCKRCKKENVDITKDYTICFDCLVGLDINHKDYERYKK